MSAIRARVRFRWFSQCVIGEYMVHEAPTHPLGGNPGGVRRATDTVDSSSRIHLGVGPATPGELGPAAP